MRGAAADRFDPLPVDRWIGAELEAGRLFGGVLEIHSNGRPVARRVFGTRDRAGHAAMTSDAVFWIASMTKPVVSVAAMVLVERGQLGLDDRVADHVPGFGSAGVLAENGTRHDVETPATVIDLMRHTSGVTYGQFGQGSIHADYGRAGVYDFSIDNRQMAERLSSLPLLHQPGTVFEYGMSTDLLGRVIEVASGDTLETFIAGSITGPLGMSSTAFRPGGPAIVDPPVFDGDNSLVPRVDCDLRSCSGGGGLWSTVSDYLKFAEMLKAGGSYRGGRILEAETVRCMLTDHLPPGVGYGAYSETLGITAPWPANGLGFGLGLAVRTARRAHLPGGIGEFFWPGVSGTNFWVDPDRNLTVVFMTHAPQHRERHRAGLRHAVYAAIGLGPDEI